MGGLWFAVSTVGNQAFCLATVFVFRWDLVIAVSCLAGSWILLNCAFLASVNRRHIWSFVDTRTGKQFTVDGFMAAGPSQEKSNDEFRLNTLYMRQEHWESIRPDVEAWVADRWAGWKADRPHWLTPSVVGIIMERGLVPKGEVPAELPSYRRRSGGGASKREVADDAGALNAPKIKTSKSKFFREIERSMRLKVKESFQQVHPLDETGA